MIRPIAEFWWVIAGSYFSRRFAEPLAVLDFAAGLHAGGATSVLIRVIDGHAMHVWSWRSTVRARGEIMSRLHEGRADG